MPYFGASPSSTLASADLNGQALILDADADTTITADTDDQIDVRIAGADDFRMTANTLTALSGSTIATNTIAETTGGSGVTIDGLLIKDTTAAFADGAVTTPSITNTGDLNTGVYFPAADTVGVTAGGTEQFRFGSNPIPGGEKNLVINGGMTVAQRGSQTGQYSGYTAVDRFWFQEGGSIQARFTTTQDGSGGGGHANSLKLDTTTAESTIASGDLLNLQHRIEAQNLQHLQWGSASAKDVTLSFWMSSPKTGTHCVSLYQADATRSYISEFTIASANTFEYFSVTIPGDTGGTINDDTGAGLYVSFPILSGTTYQAAAGSWLASEDYATSNQQNLADSTSNNIFVTGVQLEVGSVATDFAHEDIGTTIAKCQRYFNRIASGDSDIVSTVIANNADTYWYGAYHFPVEMRAIPTEATNNDAHFSIINNGAATACSSVQLSGRTSTKAVSWENLTASRTAGHGGTFISNNASSTLDLLAEL